MLTIQRAILHSFDFETGSCMLSQSELNVSDRVTRSFVQRHLRRAKTSAESRKGAFVDKSAFAERLQAYLAVEGGFVELSQEVGQWFWEELRRAEALEQMDLLVCEFEDSAQMKVDKNVTDQELADAFEGKADRYFAVMLLPRRQGFVHDVRPEGAEIACIDALLPNPTQKVESFVLVNEKSFAIEYADKPRGVAGVERMLIPDGFLQCTSEASSKEAVEALTEIVREVAEQAGREPAIEVSRAKAAVARAVDVEERFSPAQIGREVFEQDEELMGRYEEAVVREKLPEEVGVRRGLVSRLAKNHRIRTDTGVEISFPATLAEREGYIEFTREDDGHITISIKGVAHIENR